MSDALITNMITGSKLKHLYNKEFEPGKRFFYLVDESCNDSQDIYKIRISPRIFFQVVFIKANNDIESIKIIKLDNDINKQEINLSKFNFQQLREFLKFIDDIDLSTIQERRIKVNDFNTFDNDTIKSINTFLSGEDGEGIIIDLIKNGVITSQDVVNIAYRIEQLRIFEKLLNEKDYWMEYSKKEGIPDGKKEEKVWQYFFNRNEWIFGYGLNYIYNNILQNEFNLSHTQGDGSGAVITDFLLADNNYTVFVEIKKPTTELFSSSTPHRTNTWKLSNSLLEAYSQILEQKASGQLRFEGEIYGKDETQRKFKITQKAIDPKVFLVIGNLKQIENDDEYNKNIKLRTFELFRRDSRNVEIMTYDELYDRAKYIVNKYQTINSK